MSFPQISTLYWYSTLYGYSRGESMHIDGVLRQKPVDFQQGHFQNGRQAAILEFLVFRL